MVQDYVVTGMTCGGCEKSVRTQLMMVPGVLDARVSKDNQTASLTSTDYISIDTLKKSLSERYQIIQLQATPRLEHGWLKTYKPIFLIFAYITAIAFICGFYQQIFNWMTFMNVFMAGFFLIFSFFKMVDLKAFANSYQMYDVIAKRLPAWGYIYACLEIALGLAFATGFYPILTNSVAFLVMSISIIGVLQSLVNKQNIQCACLGSVFKLPMSTVTIVEDALMIAMSGTMLLYYVL